MSSDHSFFRTFLNRSFIGNVWRKMWSWTGETSYRCHQIKLPYWRSLSPSFMQNYAVGMQWVYSVLVYLPWKGICGSLITSHCIFSSLIRNAALVMHGLSAYACIPIDGKMFLFISRVNEITVFVFHSHLCDWSPSRPALPGLVRICAHRCSECICQATEIFTHSTFEVLTSLHPYSVIHIALLNSVFKNKFLYCSYEGRNVATCLLCFYVHLGLYLYGAFQK